MAAHSTLQREAEEEKKQFRKGGKGDVLMFGMNI